MCNLYSNTIPQDVMRERFGILPGQDRIGNQPSLPAIFPGHDAPAVRMDGDGQRELVMMKWGFVMRPKSTKTGKLLAPKAVNNARDDKLAGRFWNASFRDRRCLIPASSFCEAKGSKPATYYWFGVTGEGPRPPFAFAGIWRDFKGEWRGDEIEIPTSSIVTSVPNELVKPIHPSRMVVILPETDWEQWLTGSEDDARALIKPFPAEAMQIVQSGENLKSDRGEA